jgi:hypothetical protein
MKGKITRSGSHSSLLSIKNTLLDSFKKKITSKVIVRLRKRAFKNAKRIMIN